MRSFILFLVFFSTHPLIFCGVLHNSKGWPYHIDQPLRQSCSARNLYLVRQNRSCFSNLPWTLRKLWIRIWGKHSYKWKMHCLWRQSFLKRTAICQTRRLKTLICLLLNVYFTLFLVLTPFSRRSCWQCQVKTCYWIAFLAADTFGQKVSTRFQTFFGYLYPERVSLRDGRDSASFI